MNVYMTERLQSIDLINRQNLYSWTGVWYVRDWPSTRFHHLLCNDYAKSWFAISVNSKQTKLQRVLHETRSFEYRKRR